MNIFITGVSKGLGLEILKLSLKQSHTVYCISRSTTDELKFLIDIHKGKLFYRKFDLSEVDSIRKTLFKEFLPISIPIHCFVNNAAIAYDDIITNMNYEPLKTMFDVNTFSPMLITKYIIRNMIFNRLKGSIIHISSISVHTGYKGLAMYAASKGALEAFSKNTAREWGGKKIRSNTIVAGFMDTNMSSTLSEQQVQRIANRTSLKELTSIESVANLVLHLAEDTSLSITGQNIHVDSGTI